MQNRKLDARMIAQMGLLIALTVTLSRLVSLETPFIKFSFTFVPQVIMGILFGPVWSGIGAVIADLVGMALFAKATFFIGFTLNAFVEGWIYGYFFHNKEITLKRTIFVTLLVTVLINLIMTPIWLAMMFHVPLFSWVVWGPRLLKAVIWTPIQIGMIYIIGQHDVFKRLITQLAIKNK